MTERALLFNKVESLENETSSSHGNRYQSVLSQIIEYGTKLHERYVQDGAMSEQETDVMKICLSSLLDLVDLNSSVQLKSVFKENYSDTINKYNSMFPTKEYTLNKKMEAHFIVVAKKCKDSNSSSDARRYLQKDMFTNRKESKVIEQVLDILDEEEKFLFNNISNPKLITEGDILTNVWAPLLKKVFAVGNHLVRTKLGESISPYSQAQKQYQYIDSKNVKVFKIDIRFVYDCRGEEYDVGAGEVAREAIDEAKVLHDKSKLLREAKDVLDGLLNTVILEADAKTAIGHAIQIKGLCAQVISVFLATNGLYVAKPVFKIQ